jgi:hypothetical protein
VCRDETIIGHGRRLRQGHDDRHECIWVRRGICQPCSKTFTILPDWLAPSGHYSLRCRQQALLIHQLKLTLPNQPPPRIAAPAEEPLPPLKL